MVDGKAFEKMIERALIEIFSKHLNDPENNALNVAIFSAPEFQSIYKSMVQVARVSNDATKAVNQLMGIIKKQQDQITDLAGALEILLGKLETDADVVLKTTAPDVKKTEKPN